MPNSNDPLTPEERRSMIERLTHRVEEMMWEDGRLGLDAAAMRQALAVASDRAHHYAD